MELAGYPSKYNALLLAGKNLNKEIAKRLSSGIRNFSDKIIILKFSCPGSDY